MVKQQSHLRKKGKVKNKPICKKYLPGEMVLARIGGEEKVVRVVCASQGPKQSAIQMAEVEDFSGKKRYIIKCLQIIEKI